MLPEQEQIPVSVDDLQELNKFGIHIADLTDLIHDTVRNFRAERCDALSAQPSGLTLAEREILKDGGALGVDDDDAMTGTTLHLASLMQLKFEFKRLLNESLDAKQVAALLRISTARVRQLSAPDNRGLYHFKGVNEERRYPEWQFDLHQAIPHLRELLDTFSVEVHPVTVHRFMTTETPDLEAPELEKPPSPRDWLIAGFNVEPVLTLVRDL